MSCALEPVFELKSYTLIGYRVVRRVLRLATDLPLPAAEHERLSRADMERIDFATIARGLDRLANDGGEAQHPTLIIPVSFVTLSSQRSRAVLTDLFERAQRVVQRGLICEVRDMDGAPQAALSTALSFIKPYCLFITGQITAVQASTARNLKESGLRAISIDAPPGLDPEAGVYGWMRGAVAASKAAAKPIMIYGLPNPRAAAMAAALGATHASLRPPETDSGD